MEPLLLKVAQVVQLTSLCKSKVYQMIASGELQSVRLGRSVRVPTKAIFELVESASTGLAQS